MKDIFTVSKDAKDIAAGESCNLCKGGSLCGELELASKYPDPVPSTSGFSAMETAPPVTASSDASVRSPNKRSRIDEIPEDVQVWFLS